MSVLRTSRELAERVEIDAQKHPNLLRRGAWGMALVAGALTLFGLVFASFRGEHRIYEAGPLSAAHTMFENDCAKCHDKWSLGRRLVALNEGVQSVSNSKCLACHDGQPHFTVAASGPKTAASGDQGGAQDDPHDDPHHGIACATCHREHQGKSSLARVADAQCVRCHGNLQAIHPPAVAYANDIRHFDPHPKSGAHPAFAIERLVASKAEKSADGSAVPAARSVHEIIKFLKRPAAPSKSGEPGDNAQWQDAARIRFNHAVHLKPGLPGSDGKPLDLSRDCGACHEPDSERLYMKPIQYQKHCAACHPLYFDTAFPGQTVPHEQPEIVRGFLTDFYVLRHSAPATAEERLPARPLPGRSYAADLTKEAARQVEQNVGKAEAQTREHRLHDFAPHIPLDQFNRSGGCRYCHQVSVSADNTIWTIEPPRIPQRWLKQSRFSHDTHRVLNCTECHRDLASGKPVTLSTSTGDVLMPGIDVCRKCHASSPAAGSTIGDARTDCVECHVYHQRQRERTGGKQTLSELLGVAP